MEYLCHQESLHILFSPTLVFAPVTLTITGIEPTRNTRNAGKKRALEAHESEDSMLQSKHFFIITIFSEINLKNYKKSDGSGVLVGGPPNFQSTSLLIASSDKPIFIQAIGSLIVAAAYRQFSLK